MAVLALCVGTALILMVVRHAWRRTGHRYILTTAAIYYTDLTLRVCNARTRTVPLVAVDRAEIEQTRWQAFLGIGDVVIRLYAEQDAAKAGLRLVDVPEPYDVLRLVRHQLLVLSVDAGPEQEPGAGAMPCRALASPGRDAGRGTLQSGKERQVHRPGTRAAAFSAVALPIVAAVVFAGIMAIRTHGSEETGARRPHADPIYAADGSKRPRAEIVLFMEAEVLPFAKWALGPIIGGDRYVTCETCHGEQPERRDYRMPAIAALPLTQQIGEATRRSSLTSDVQIHNAVVGNRSDYCSTTLVLSWCLYFGFA